MAQQELKFSANQLVIEGIDVLELATFNTIKKEEFETESIKKIDGSDEILSIKKVEKNIHENRFVSIVIEYGDKYPYADKVYDSSDKKDTNNPRPPEDIEYSGQLFVLVDVKFGRIYISDQRQKNSVVSLLTQKISKPVVIKPLIIEQDFIDKISSISKISLTAESSIFNTGTEYDLPQALESDRYGYGAERAVLELIYKKNYKVGNIREKIRGLIKSKDKLKAITIVGRTTDGIEAIFNTSEIVTKLSTYPTYNERTKKFIPEEVFACLIQAINSRILKDD